MKVLYIEFHYFKVNCICLSIQFTSIFFGRIKSEKK